MDSSRSTITGSGASTSGQQTQTETQGGYAARWWDRDKLLIARLRVHPCDIPLLIDLYENSMDKHGNITPVKEPKKAVYHATARHRRRKKILYTYLLRNDDRGRPRYAFSNWAVKQDTLESHELPLSYALLAIEKAYPGFTFVRGYKVDKTIRPDAEGSYKGLETYWEFFTDEQRESQVKERSKFYAEVKRPLFIIATNPKRLTELVSWGEAVDRIARYALLSDVVNNPTGAIWQDALGNLTAIPRK